MSYSEQKVLIIPPSAFPFLSAALNHCKDQNQNSGSIQTEQNIKRGRKGTGGGSVISVGFRCHDSGWSCFGTISLPKDAKLKSATYTDPDDAAELESFTRQYFYDGHPIGTAEVSSKKASSSDSSSSSSETAPTGIVTPETNRDDASSTGSLSSPLYILLGLCRWRFLAWHLLEAISFRKATPFWCLLRYGA